MEEENLSLSPEELAALDEYEKELDTYVNSIPTTDEPQEAATAVSEAPEPTQTIEPTQQQEQPATEAPVETTDDGYYPKATMGDYMSGMGYDNDTIRERLSSAGQGLIDFGVDAINFLSGGRINIETPKYEDDLAQFTREASNAVLPGLLIGGSIVKGGQAVANSSRLAASSPRLAAFTNDIAVKTIAPTLAQMGGQVGATAIARTGDDDNLPGTLRDMFPRTFSWIPENIATLDSDSADTKRLKNITFDVGLGFATDLIPAIARFAKAQQGMFQATRFVPEDEVAETFFKNVNFDDPALTLDELIEDTVNNSALQRTKALDEVGQYNLSKKMEKSVDIDEPIFGVHDMYGYRESGVRGVDDLGIVGAKLDNARIYFNEGSTYGRVGNSITDGALKFALDDDSGGAIYDITKGLSEQLKMAGKYGYETAPGRYLTSAQIDEAATAMIDRIFGRPVAEVEQYLQQFRSLDVGTGVGYLTAEADSAVLQSIGKYMDVYANLDETTASALLIDSMAGQISDMSFSARMMEDTDAIPRAQEMILDRVEYLMAQDGMTRYIAGRNLGMLKSWNKSWQQLTQSRNEKVARKYYEDIMKASDLGAASDDTFSALAEIKAKAKGTRQTIEAIAAKNPEFMKPLRLAWELTDGDVSSITKINKYFENLAGFSNKAVVNFNGIESLTKQAIDGIVYNNLLSAVATPIRAVESSINAATVPLNVAIGGLARGDLGPMRKAGFMYGRWLQIMRNSMNYSKQVFRRSGLTAEELPLFDSSVKLANEKQMQFIKTTAEAYAEKGDFGPMAVYEQLNTLNNLANHPWLSVIPRSLQTLDGFNTAMLAQFDSYSKAFDEVSDYGRRAVNVDDYRRIGEANYSQYFDADSDLITDKGVKSAAGEINYNKDGRISNFFGDLTRTIPAIKPFLMFTRTPIQEMGFMMKYEPFGIYARKLGKYSEPFDSPKLSKDQVIQALREDGIKAETPDQIKAAYTYQRDLALGRQAIGAFFTSVAALTYLNGGITGDGLANRQKQANVRSLGVGKRMVMNPLTGTWHSYDNLGPVSDWMAMTVTFMENFGSLDGSQIEHWLGMAMHSLSASLTEKTMLPALEPLIAISRGDASQLKRFAGSYLSSASVLGSGQIAEWGRLFDPMKQDMEATFLDQIMTRNPLGRQLVNNQVDYIDGGGDIGVPINPLVQLWNTYTPWKVNGAISPAKQYLLDVEYDGRAVLKTFNGIQLTPNERNQVARIIGEKGYYRDQILQLAEQYPAEQFRSDVRTFQGIDSGLGADRVDRIHSKLDKALRTAITTAVSELDNASEIYQRKVDKKVLQGYAEANQPNNARTYLEQQQQRGY